MSNITINDSSLTCGILCDIWAVHEDTFVSSIIQYAWAVIAIAVFIGFFFCLRLILFGLSSMLFKRDQYKNGYPLTPVKLLLYILQSGVIWVELSIWIAYYNLSNSIVLTTFGYIVIGLGFLFQRWFEDFMSKKSLRIALLPDTEYVFHLNGHSSISEIRGYIGNFVNDHVKIENAYIKFTAKMNKEMFFKEYNVPRNVIKKGGYTKIDKVKVHTMSLY